MDVDIIIGIVGAALLVINFIILVKNLVDKFTK
jgi:hypothetical protein